MTATLSALIQPLYNGSLVQRWLKQLEPTVQNPEMDNAELESFLKKYFDQGIFLNGSSSF